MSSVGRSTRRTCGVVLAALLLGAVWMAPSARATGNACVSDPRQPTTFMVDAVTFLEATSYAVCAHNVADLTSTSRIEEHLASVFWKARGVTVANNCPDCQRTWAEAVSECMDGTFRTEGRAVGVFYPGDEGDQTDDSLSGNKDIDCPLPFE